MNLNATQVSAVLAPSTRYPAATYQSVIDKLRKSKSVVGVGNIEESFPGVKPAHVAHMLKKLRGDDETLVVDTHSEFGVCLIKIKPADEAS